jgi:hypothetical protein
MACIFRLQASGFNAEDGGQIFLHTVGTHLLDKYSSTQLVPTCWINIPPHSWYPPAGQIFLHTVGTHLLDKYCSTQLVPTCWTNIAPHSWYPPAGQILLHTVGTHLLDPAVSWLLRTSADVTTSNLIYKNVSKFSSYRTDVLGQSDRRVMVITHLLLVLSCELVRAILLLSALLGVSWGDFAFTELRIEVMMIITGLYHR